MVGYARMLLRGTNRYRGRDQPIILLFLPIMLCCSAHKFHLRIMIRTAIIVFDETFLKATVLRCILLMEVHLITLTDLFSVHRIM